MRRRLLVLVGIFAAAYLVGLATEVPMTVAVVVTVAVGFLWIVARDVRRTTWAAESQRSQDAAYAAAAFAALHAPGQGAADCPSGFDGGFSGGADCGGLGV
jgi:hypothetical protein